MLHRGPIKLGRRADEGVRPYTILILPGETFLE